MIKENQYFEIKWNPNNKKYYESKGYNFTRNGDDFEVKGEDLPKGSHQKIIVICDYCHEEIEVFAYNYFKSIKQSKTFACKKCRTKKIQKTMLEKYGKNAPSKIPEFKEKMRQTNLEKYGVENPMQSQEIQDKFKNSMNKKFGVSSPLQSPLIKEKACATCRERYGVDHVLQAESVRVKIIETLENRYGVSNIMDIQVFRDKAKKTCMERYGGESSQASPSIRKKSWETMQENGNIPTSKAELKMVSLLKEIYGENNCFPQYLLDRISMDCLLIVEDTKIDVEYDGDYWHQDKQKDNRRDNYCVRRGYKVLRFKSKYNTPSIEQIKQGVDYLVDSEHHILKVNI